MKGKSKLVPRWLGVTKDSVMHMDEKTKEVLQEWPLTTVKRWTASPKSLTLDFDADQKITVKCGVYIKASDWPTHAQMRSSNLFHTY